MFRIVHVVRRNLNEYIVCVLSVDIENMREEGGSSNDYNMMYDDETGWLSHFGIQPAPVYKNDSPHRSRLSTTKYIFFFCLFVCLFLIFFCLFFKSTCK